MDNDTLTSGVATPERRRRPSRMPVQAAPINRARDASSTLSGGPGVEPAIWGALASLLPAVANIAIPAAQRWLASR